MTRKVLSTINDWSLGWCSMTYNGSAAFTIPPVQSEGCDRYTVPLSQATQALHTKLHTLCCTVQCRRGSWSASCYDERGMERGGRAFGRADHTTHKWHSLTHSLSGPGGANWWIWMMPRGGPRAGLQEVKEEERAAPAAEKGCGIRHSISKISYLALMFINLFSPLPFLSFVPLVANIYVFDILYFSSLDFASYYNHRFPSMSVAS